MARWRTLVSWTISGPHAADVREDLDVMYHRDRAAGHSILRASWTFLRRALASAYWVRRGAGSFSPRGPLVGSEDVKYAMRRLRRQPVATTVSIVALACAIGAVAATWSLISTLLLHPVRVPDADRLHHVRVINRADGQAAAAFTVPAAMAIRDAAVAPMAAWGSLAARTPLLVQGSGEPRERSAIFTSADYLDVLGLRPARGRYFSEADDRDGASPVAVISAKFWKAEFGRDDGVVGRTIAVRGVPTVVVGVAPEGFGGLSGSGATDLFMPLRSMHRVMVWEPVVYSESPPGPWVRLVARLEPGQAAPDVAGRLDIVAPGLGASFADRSFALLDVVSAATSATGRTDLRKFMGLLAGTVGLLLLISGLTAGTLLLVRTESRGAEFATCLAMGAPRRRLAAGVILEGAIVTFTGALLAVPMSQVMFVGIASYRLPGNIRLEALELAVDSSILLGATAAAVAVTTLMAALAASFVLRGRHADTLRAASGSTPRVIGQGARSLLIAAQVAVAIVLATGAGLFARSIQRALSFNPGVDTARVVAGEVAPVGAYGYDAVRFRLFVDQLRTRLSSHPAVRTVAFAESYSGVAAVDFDGQRHKVGGSLQGVDPGYVETIGLRLLAGRTLSDVDSAEGPRVAMLSVSFARALGGVERVVGRSLSNGQALPSVTVVGIVDDLVVSAGFVEPAVLYVPRSQFTTFVYPGGPGPRIALKATHSVGAAAEAVRAAVQAIDPIITPNRLVSIDDGILAQMGTQRLGATLMGALGTLAFLLSVLGTYVLAESVSLRRRREMGIRAALGATGQQLRNVLLRDTARLVGAGLVVGMAVTWLSADAIRAFLILVDPLDPWVLATVAVSDPGRFTGRLPAPSLGGDAYRRGPRAAAGLTRR